MGKKQSEGMSFGDALAIYLYVRDNPQEMSRDDVEQAYLTARWMIGEYAEACIKEWAETSPGRWFPTTEGKREETPH